MVNNQNLLTYLYLFINIVLSSAVILYNKWVLSTKYFNFPYPITLTVIHMGFSGLVAFFIIHVFKLVAPVNMTSQIYGKNVFVISFCSAVSLMCGNTAYLFISVAFIQMLKALMPVATFLVAVYYKTDTFRYKVFLNMLLVSFGVVISSYGEIAFSIIGTTYQVVGIFAESLKLVLIEVLLKRNGLILNPITTLYYIAPCCCACLLVPWFFAEMPQLEIAQIQFNAWIFFTNALCALALNLSTFLVVGRTGAVTVRVVGVLKDCILIGLSTVIFPDSTITNLNVIGYLIALCGVVMYTYWKTIDSSQTPAAQRRSQSDSDLGVMNESSQAMQVIRCASFEDVNIDEEAPLISSSKGLFPRLRPI